ncbi:MAG: protein O-mannosyl-transferase family [Anaerolineae bacterium]
MIPLSGLVAVGVYWRTLAPSITWAHWGGDGGDFVTSAVTGRLPHPPGFPLYFLASRGVVRLIGGDPARALNVLSALSAGGSVSLTAATLRRRGLPWPVQLSSALTLGFAPWLWSQAVITEVYACGALFASAVVFVAGTDEGLGRWRSLLAGLVVGCAAAVHPTLLLLGAYVLFLYRPSIPLFGLGALLGLVPYALLPLQGPWPQPWGDLSSFSGWLDYVTAQVYWGNAFGLPARYWPERILAFVSLGSRQFTPVGAVVVGLGFWASWRLGRGRTAALLGILGVVSLYAIGYNSADSWVYLVGYLPVVVLMLAEGWRWVVDQGVSSTLSLLLPVALLALNWRQMDLHNDQEAAVWLESMLRQLPSSATVLSEEDRHTMTLWYGTDGLGRRPDLVIVDRRLWWYTPYRQTVSQRASISVERPEELAVGGPLCEITDDGEVRCL